MGSTGEPDRKRRHFSSLSPTAATAKKHPFFPPSEEKKAWLSFTFPSDSVILCGLLVI